MSTATKTTYFYERWRALAAGVLEAAATIFLLLIAVRHYEAGLWAKALIAGGGSFGLVLAPWIAPIRERFQLNNHPPRRAQRYG